MNTPLQKPGVYEPNYEERREKFVPLTTQSQPESSPKPRRQAPHQPPQKEGAPSPDDGQPEQRLPVAHSSPQQHQKGRQKGYVENRNPLRHNMP